MVPSGPHAILARGDQTAYLGVELRSEDGQAVPRQNVSVTLPPGNVLEFESMGSTPGTLSVMDASNNLKSYEGVLSGDVLTFTNVDLALPAQGSTSQLLVEVRKCTDAPAVATRLTFAIGDQVSDSSHVVVWAEG
ncbi:hypothetical protein [Streptomyces globisporus]|uniref:hypothetical protein n=1 Tax=Streptomyces globisporus TaxID=1908 RepID=UPI0037BC6B45